MATFSSLFCVLRLQAAFLFTEKALMKPLNAACSAPDGRLAVELSGAFRDEEQSQCRTQTPLQMNRDVALSLQLSVCQKK